MIYELIYKATSKSFLIISCFLLLLLFDSNNILAQNTPLTVLPFEIRADNRIYVKCRVNEVSDLSFMFDTGASGTVINQSILGKRLNLTLDGEGKNIGANGTSKVAVSNNNTLAFGDVSLSNTRLVAIPYGDKSFDGVFGSDVMRRYIIEIDYTKKQLRFYDHQKYRYQTSSYTKYRLKEESGLFLIKGSINVNRKKYEGDFEVDTGGDNSLTLTRPFVEKNQLGKLFKTVAKATATGSDGSSVESPIVVLPEIQLGSKYFYRPPALLSTAQSGVFANSKIAGIFGNNFLKRFNVILDFSHRRMFLEPNDLIHAPYYDFLIEKILNAKPKA